MHGVKIGGISLALSLAAFFFLVSDLTSYGVTWDEFFHRATGQAYYEFIKTGDIRPIGENDGNAWFPPVAVTIGYAFIANPYLREIYPKDMDRFHLAAVVFGSVTVGIVYSIAWMVFRSYWFALYASLLLLFHPQFIAHAHMNVRDMGLMMFYALTIALILLSGMSRHPIIYMGASGAMAGVTTDVKQNGAFLVIIGLIWFMLQKKALGRRNLLVGGALFLFFFFYAWVFFWPFLWVDTVRHVHLVWKFLTNPEVIAGTTTMYGKVYTSMKDIPIYYPWAMISLLTPPLVVCLAVVGIIQSVRGIVRRNPHGILVLWIGIPLARFVFPLSSIAYDQIRHELEVLPVLPLCAAATLAMAYQYTHRGKRAVRAGVVSLAAGALIHSVLIGEIYRPYTTAYFNIFAGPPDYVSRSFDVEYWGNVYREAVTHLNQRYGTKPVYYTAGTGTHLLVEEGLDPEQITDDQDADFQYVIFMNKQNFLRENEYVQWLLDTKKPVYVIERQGVVLFYQFLAHKREYKQWREQKTMRKTPCVNGQTNCRLERIG